MSIEAMKLALEELEGCYVTFYEDEDIAEAITALRQAIEQESDTCNPHPKAPHGFNRNASHSNDRYTCDCEGWDAYEAGYQDGLQKGLEMEQAQQAEPVVGVFDYKEHAEGLQRDYDLLLAEYNDLKAQQAEPVAWMTHSNDITPLFHKTKKGALNWQLQPTPLYTSPPTRKPLTDEEYSALAETYTGADGLDCVDYGRAIARHYGITGEQK